MKYLRLNGEAVYAILADHKCQMRFALERQDFTSGKMTEAGFVADILNESGETGLVIKPPYAVGDILAVKETWAVDKSPYDGKEVYIYRTNYPFDTMTTSMAQDIKWKQSTFMPKEAARVFLLVTGMKVERLQDISLEDIEREGVFINGNLFPIDEFRKIWAGSLAKSKREIHKYENNPWVYAVLFRRIGRDEAMRLSEQDGKV